MGKWLCEMVDDPAWPILLTALFGLAALVTLFVTNLDTRGGWSVSPGGLIATGVLVALAVAPFIGLYLRWEVFDDEED